MSYEVVEVASKLKGSETWGYFEPKMLPIQTINLILY